MVEITQADRELGAQLQRVWFYSQGSFEDGLKLIAAHRTQAALAARRKALVGAAALADHHPWAGQTGASILVGLRDAILALEPKP